jgi:acylphosphatase
MTYAVTGQVYGHVQGVGFRHFVKQNALAYRLSGWVKNCDDGSVEVCLAGDRAAVTHMQEVVASGPRQANVQTISWKPVNEDVEHIQGFSIR